MRILAVLAVLSVAACVDAPTAHPSYTSLDLPSCDCWPEGTTATADGTPLCWQDGVVGRFYGKP